MINDVSDFVSIFFFDKQHEISMHDIKDLRYSANLKSLVNSLGFETFIVLDQTHSSKGVCVEQVEELQYKDSFESWFKYQGDFLITNKKKCALVILTADCVPIVFYDNVNQAIGAAHAGWKGTVGQVAKNTIVKMQQAYGTKLSDLQSFFGWSAGDCCYEVTPEFLDHFKKFDYGQNSFVKKGGKIYFNNRLHLYEGLKKFGIRPEKIYTTNDLCTICNVRFCSARRDKDLAGRQVTVVALK
ncbi:MAG: peptidoglycan editing factor PgeF [Candidatus Dependentiae bacterium]|nr:peptidoglycan editing factor PgeF [Candidatus Dependentiae bacterium]